jgi:type IV conjugative transfer system protein TraL
MNDNEVENDLMTVSRHVNKPKMTMLMTNDELVPTFCMIVWGMFTGNMFMYLIFSGIFLVTVKTVKRRFGSSVFIAFLYWVLPDCIGKSILKNTLPASQKFYIK